MSTRINLGKSKRLFLWANAEPTITGTTAALIEKGLMA